MSLRLIKGLLAAAFLALASVDVDSDSVQNTDTCTVSITVSGDDTFIYGAAGSLQGSGTLIPSAVTFNGDALTEIDSHVHFNGNIAISTWGLKNPDAGTHDLEFTWEINNHEIGCGGIALSGVDQTTPFGTPAEAEANDGPATVDVPSDTDELVIASVVAGSNPLTVTVGTIAWEEDPTGMSDFLGAAGSATASGASPTATVTWTIGLGGFDDRWAATGVSFKPAGEAPPVTTRRLPLMGAGK